MKKKTILYLLIVISLFSSCASNNQEIIIEDSPNWINIENNEALNYFYISEGYGDTILTASSNSINDFYEQVKNQVYIESESEFKNSLISEYYYEPLNIQIEKRYYKKIINGGYVVNYLFSYDEDLFSKNIIKYNELEEEILTQINYLEKESNTLYRSNKDLDSIKLLIELYIYSMENKRIVNANQILDIIVSRISSIYIRIIPENDNLNINLYREERFIDPKVINASIIASYNNIDLNYNNYLNQEKLNPNKDNTFDFNINNKKINEKGLIIFKIDLLEELFLLKQKGYVSAANLLEKNINETIYSYSTLSNFSNKTIYLKIIENDVNQKPLESVTSEFFIEKMKNINSQVIINNDIEIENLSQYKNIGDFLFLFRAEIVEKQDLYKPYAYSHGSLEVYDLETEELIFDSTLVDSLSINDTMEESEVNSILDVAKKAFHYLIR